MPASDIFAEYGPPFDLLSDMLFAFAFAPAAPLRAAFPGVPFLSLAGRTPLAMWFSRVKEGCYRDPAGGAVSCAGGPDMMLYNELNVLVRLRRRAGFVPGIYATSALTIAIGHGYGMPKQPTAMTLAVAGRRFRSQVDDQGRRSYVRARLLNGGPLLGALLSRLWPWWTWLAYFPDGRFVRADPGHPLCAACPCAGRAAGPGGALAAPPGGPPATRRLPARPAHAPAAPTGLRSGATLRAGLRAALRRG